MRAALATRTSWLDPATTRELLLAYGLPLVPERVAATPDEAVAAARELGFPVVVKTAAAGRTRRRSAELRSTWATRRPCARQRSASAGR